MSSDWFFQHPRLASVGSTMVFCLLIAIGLGSVLGDFVDNLIVSFCVGLSILAGSFVSQSMLGPRLQPLLLQAITLPAGLIVGLAFGGWTLRGELGYFFAEAGRSGVGLGVLFGVIGTLGFMAMHVFADLRRELELRRLQGADQARQLATAQLRVLQAQMEPHFLFNTLSNVISLIDVEPQKARSLLEQLTQLLRASLRRTRQSEATVGDEIDVVAAYLRIQQLRMGPRLQFRIDCPDELRQSPLPPLMLQPLVENAVRHGLEPAESGGTVELSLHAEPGALCLRVADTGVGVAAAAAAQRASSLNPASALARPLPPSMFRGAGEGGTSLPNLRDRLRALYGDAASLRLFANEPQGTVAELRLPIGGG